MDKQKSKHDIVLDIVEHPGKYSPGYIKERLSDSDARDIYNLLCKTVSAIESDKEIDVEAEWAVFSERNAPPSHRSHFMRLPARAASIVTIAGVSIMAVAAGIAVKIVSDGPKNRSVDNDALPATEASVSTSTDSITHWSDSTIVVIAPIMFEDKSLEAILRNVSDLYGVDIRVVNREAAALHLYYRLNPALPLDEIVSQLNTFGHIDIRQDGDTLIIE